MNDPTDPTADPIDPNIPGDVTDGTTWVYAYDLGENITAKTCYAYTIGTLPENAQGIIAYSYGNANWKDQLTSYAGKVIKYDAIGNPTYSGATLDANGDVIFYEWAYQWRAGRQLDKMTDGSNGEVYEFKYNENGLRTQKVKKNSEGTVLETTDYTLNGKLVTHLKKGEDNLHFFYDAQGRPAIVRFNGADYHYANNLQGDVVGIIDKSQNLVIEYRYSPWGKVLETRAVGTECEELAKLKPFRYRRYQYDEGTELYYLRSRYYNPEHGRFVNEDYLIGAAVDLFEHNIFVYCKNNPECKADSNGAKVEEWYTKEAQCKRSAVRSGIVVTSWDIAVMPSIRVDRIRQIAGMWGSRTAEQRQAWREEVEGYRAKWRNPNEYTDARGITRSTITNGEIEFYDSITDLGEVNIYIKVGYSLNGQGEVVLDPNGYRESVGITDLIGADYSTAT